MKLKQTVAALLCAGMMMSVFASCSEKPTAPSSDKPAPAPVASSTPEPEYTPIPLTGMPNDGSYKVGQRMAAVMIANHAGSSSYNARPQWGISDADILFEIKAEGGITRFMAMFSGYDNLPDEIGPVRSARDQFFQLILPWQPLYVHIGESTVQSEFKKNYNYEELDLNLDQYGFERDQARINMGRSTDSAAITSNEQISKLVEKNNINVSRTYNSTFFDFVNYNEPERVLTGDPAVAISITHSLNYRTYFQYDNTKQEFMMSQYSSSIGAIHDTVDGTTNEQLGFKNVFVLFADIHTNPAYVNEKYDIQQVAYNDGGVGIYFCNGKAERIRWSKPEPQQTLRITDGDGNEISTKVNPGKSYIGIVDLEESTKFVYDTDGTSNIISANGSATSGTTAGAEAD